MVLPGLIMKLVLVAMVLSSRYRHTAERFVYNSNFCQNRYAWTVCRTAADWGVYHPTKDLAYFAWAQTTEVRAYDMTTLTLVGSYDFEHTFQNTGNRAFTQGRLKISRDGSFLFATVDGGVRYVSLNGDKPPVAYDRSVQTNEDAPVPITLGADAPSGGTLTFHVLTAPQHGTLIGDAPNLTYVPAVNYYGTDSFCFNANDGNQDSNTATVTIEILSVNEQPNAKDDMAYARFGKPEVIPVLANDEDLDGDTLFITDFSQPQYGSVMNLQDGTLSYLPSVPSHSIKSRTDVFNYTISDGHGGTATAKVTVNINWK
jgi:hypothetical protein